MAQQHDLTTQEHITINPHGDISSPLGFTAGGMHIGLRAYKRDFGWIYSNSLANAAAVYTLNQFKAAPLIVTQKTLAKHQQLQAIIVNSANANSCTGQQGIQDAYQTQKWASQQFNISPDYIAIASTGVIGEHLPMSKIKYGTEHLLDKPYQQSHFFNQAILTTDTQTKQIAVTTTIEGQTVTIGGTAKGSGMIHPNMATMLAFISTDATIDASTLDDLLRQTVNQTFNMITVDGDTSTNDMVIALANGQVNHNTLNKKHDDWHKFAYAFHYVCDYLAQAIARDGEGATKLVTVNVNEATTTEQAQQIAKSIVGSNLVKAAIHGEDANFGRIITAIGYTSCQIDPEKLTILINQIAVMRNGTVVSFDETTMKQSLSQSNIIITVNLGIGHCQATAYGCDLSYDYVRINASYRT